jgi:two-component system, OmpR family, alkaline phosphatase synthesis response regulator PhoP
MGEKKKILVIDDDVQFVETVKTLLENVGYEVHFAYQARKGIDLAKQITPDLILLDVMFAGPPGPDGIESSRELGQVETLKNVPVIIISGIRKVLDLPYDLEPDQAWMPVKAFVEKPIKPDKLLAEISSALGTAK